MSERKYTFDYYQLHETKRSAIFLTNHKYWIFTYSAFEIFQVFYAMEVIQVQDVFNLVRDSKAILCAADDVLSSITRSRALSLLFWHVSFAVYIALHPTYAIFIHYFHHIGCRSFSFALPKLPLSSDWYERGETSRTPPVGELKIRRCQVVTGATSSPG